MSLFSDPADRELNAYLMYSKDGLQDMLVGLIIFVAGLLIFTDNSSFLAIIAVLAYPFMLMGKKMVTMPRVARSELPPEKVIQKRFLLLLGLGTFTMVLGSIVFLLLVQDWVSFDTIVWQVLSWSIGIIVVSLLIYFLWRGGNRRLPIYILLFLGAYFTLSRAGLELPFALMLLGMTVTVIGAAMLVRFIQTHPVLD